MKPTAEQIERLAASLREIDPGALQEDPAEGKVRWFQGEGGTEIFVWAHPDQPPHHIQLVFADVSVEWSQKGGLLTGSFAETATTMGGRHDPYVMRLERVADMEVCRAALQLLSTCRVEPRLLQPLVDALKTFIDPVP